MFGGGIVPPVPPGAATVYVNPEIYGARRMIELFFKLGAMPPALPVADPMVNRTERGLVTQYSAY